MGCLPSRMTAVKPVEERDNQANDNSSTNSKFATKAREAPSVQTHKASTVNGNGTQRPVLGKNSHDSATNQLDSVFADSMTQEAVNGTMKSQSRSGRPNGNGATTDSAHYMYMSSDKTSNLSNGYDGEQSRTQKNDASSNFVNESTENDDISSNGSNMSQKNKNDTQTSDNVDEDAQTKDENPFVGELDMDLLRLYVAIDYEISQLEDKDALRIYHEKIEQLEQLEHELDMISAEAEEVAARSESSRQQNQNSAAASLSGEANKIDGESNSVVSGATYSISQRSSLRKTAGKSNIAANTRQINKNTTSGLRNSKFANNDTQLQKKDAIESRRDDSANIDDSRRFKNLSYSTVEVFNRKIVLEKERDKLKKEVEVVINECDKLQQRYKRRDEILDKLFDGRTGTGLENHLEQQLNWLMEQKHYVDQVFYAWKRAESLTSQSCEQLASASDLLKRLPSIQNERERSELAKQIANLLIKSRQDMEQAQRYNPNVDAPFFTDTETERFDKIIEIISAETINQKDYNQAGTVIQSAYKRAVSIRLWLEQILQITIARDSFELAEEYKWIAIQLRKERITLVNAKLQESPYRSAAQSVREQLMRQRQQSAQSNIISDNKMSGSTRKTGQNEINRDSGVESDDIDIEEEIYRLLEMNKTRLEANKANSTASQLFSEPNSAPPNQQLQVHQLSSPVGNSMNPISRLQDQKTDAEILREQAQANAREEDLEQLAPRSATSNDGANATNWPAAALSTLSKLKIELDEAARQNLMKQIDQIHLRHKSRVDRLRGDNRTKARDYMIDRLQKVSRAET